MKTVVQGLVGILLAAVLLAWAFHGVHREDLVTALSQASWPMLALGSLINFAHNHFRVLRWRWLLEPVSPGLRYRPLAAAVVLGYMTTWVIPGRIGELVRPALLTSKEKVPLGPCMGSVVADRILDGIAILILF